jgi:hypothetical protein
MGECDRQIIVRLKGLNPAYGACPLEPLWVTWDNFFPPANRASNSSLLNGNGVACMACVDLSTGLRNGNTLADMFAGRFFDYTLQDTRVIGLHSDSERNYIIDRGMMALDRQRDRNVMSMGEYIRPSSLDSSQKK